MKVLKLAGVATLICALGLGALLVVGAPKAPPSSPRSYPAPGPAPSLVDSENGWVELVAASRSHQAARFDDKGQIRTQPDQARLGQALGQLAAARQRRAFRITSEAGDFDGSVLATAYDLAETSLQKGDPKPALDYLSAVSRIRFAPEFTAWDREVVEAGPKVRALLDKMAVLPLDLRRRSLQELDKIVSEQGAFEDHLAFSREAVVRARQQLHNSPAPPGLAGLLQRKISAATPDVVAMTRAKYDRWIYFVRDGDFDMLHRDAELYWSSPPPSGKLGHLLWTARLLLSPAEALASVGEETPLQGATDLLCLEAITYIEDQLVWQAGRLRLALGIFQQEKGRFPDSLQELVSAGLIKTVPQDPYFLKGAEARALPEAALGYDGEKAWSVGWDGVDQNGEVGLEEFTSLDAEGDRLLWRR